MKIQDIFHLRLRCNRCDSEWWPREPKEPETCPNCKSRYWNKERKLKVKS